jgi:hypothetical protein
MARAITRFASAWDMWRLSCTADAVPSGSAEDAAQPVKLIANPSEASAAHRTPRLPDATPHRTQRIPDAFHHQLTPP